jgi:hypothetical protein
MRASNNYDVPYPITLQQNVLDLRRVDIRAAYIDHVKSAINEIDIPVRVTKTKIADAKKA